MKKIITVMLLFFLVLGSNCKKKKQDAHVPPTMDFKTGGKYISGDRTCKKQDTLLVGVNITKTEDNLKSFNVSYQYDGGTQTTFYNYNMQESEYNGYSKDVTIITRNQAGTEKWIFAVIDRDGNITQKSLTFTVQ
jgi:hypothetical protein